MSARSGSCGKDRANTNRAGRKDARQGSMPSMEA
ncbi:MAG: hypothetical protein RIS70_1348, partial [Planctomycetota bacterium]